ncbi:ankyrin repeat domain-containing protein [Candidatus Babeliales bacterium]|nr:ankyrin repeat domain-containing protein [Candidatus Babeliales bacterium]
MKKISLFMFTTLITFLSAHGVVTRAHATPGSLYKEYCALLHHHAAQGNANCLKIILQNPQAQQALESRSQHLKLTPLLQALFWPHHTKKHCACVKTLLAAGASTTATTQNRKSTAIHLASRAGCLTCIEALCKYDSKTWQKDRDGNTPAGVAQKYAEFYTDKENQEKFNLCLTFLNSLKIC